MKLNKNLEVENPELLSQHIDRPSLHRFFLYFLWLEGEIVYIGQTIDIDNRMKAHKDKLFDNKTFKIYDGISREEMLEIERANITKYKPIFNDNFNVTIKKPEYIFRRDRSRSRKYNKGVLYKDKGDTRISYYDGESLHEYIRNELKMVHFIDGIIEKEVLTSGILCIQWSVENNKVKHKLVRRYEKEIDDFERKRYNPKKITSQEMLLKTVLDFGQHRGYSIKELIDFTPDYVVWLIKKVWLVRAAQEVHDALTKKGKINV